MKRYINDIQDLSNYAAAMIGRQAYDDAINYLLTALLSLKKINTSYKGDSGHVKGMVVDPCMVTSNGLAKFTPNPEQEADGDGTSLFLYRHAISIPPGVDSLLTTTPIVVFNLALAHHLKAKQQKAVEESRTELLRKALRLYETAYNLIRTNPHHFEFNSLFAFASINNIALINLDLDDVEQSDKCFDYMLSGLMVYVDCGKGQDLKCINGFLRNSIRKICVSASAA
eukprot:scaffold406_cov57-Cylindrotheca_fusiformis.AAC.18